MSSSEGYKQAAGGISLKRDSRNKHRLTFNLDCPDLIISVAKPESQHKHIHIYTYKGMSKILVLVNNKFFLDPSVAMCCLSDFQYGTFVGSDRSSRSHNVVTEGNQRAIRE